MKRSFIVPPLFDFLELSLEAREEVRHLSVVAYNTGHGMKVIKPANVWRSWEIFSQDKTISFANIDRLFDGFMHFLIDRRRRQIDLWEAEGAATDIRLFIARKIWEHKIKTGEFESPQAFLIVQGIFHTRDMRGMLHEAVNHAVKHDELALLQEQLDDMLKARLDEFWQPIQEAFIGYIPELNQKVLGSDNNE